MGQEIPDGVAFNARVRDTLAPGGVVEEPPRPVHVGALGSIGIVSCAQAQPQLFQRRQRIGLAEFIDQRVLRPVVPVCSMEEVHEVDTKGLFSLAHLPVLAAAVPLQFVAEVARLVHERLLRGGARQEPADPAHEVRRGPLSGQLGLEQELPELLQRRLQFAHSPAVPRGSNPCATPGVGVVTQCGARAYGHDGISRLRDPRRLESIHRYSGFRATLDWRRRQFAAGAWLGRRRPSVIPEVSHSANHRRQNALLRIGDTGIMRAKGHEGTRGEAVLGRYGSSFGSVPI